MQRCWIYVVYYIDYIKLTLPLTTGHGKSALHIHQAVWLSGVSPQATF